MDRYPMWLTEYDWMANIWKESVSLDSVAGWIIFYFHHAVTNHY